MCRLHCVRRSGEEENIKTYKENKNIFTYFCRCGRRSIETPGPYCSDGWANQTKNCDRYLTIKRKKSAHAHTHTRVVLLDWPARSPTPTRIHTQTCALSSHADNGKKYI